IAVDYSLLYSTRLGFTSNARQTLSDIVSPMVIGNITTVGAFLSLLVMSASGMRDFGLFAAVSLVGAIFFVIIFLPHWVGEKHYKPKSNGWLGRWAGFRPEENRYLFWLLVVATVVFYLFSRKVTFSGDFTKINYMAPAQSQLLDKLSSYSGREGSVAVYAVTEGATLSDALYAAEKNRAFTDSSVKSGNVLSSRGIGPFLPSEREQQRRLSLWKSFVEKNGETLLNSLDKAGEAAGFTSDAFDSFKALFTSELGVQQEEFFSPIGTLMAPFILRDSSTSIVMEILYTPKDNLSSLYSSYKDYGNKAEGSFLFDSYSMTDGMIDILQKDFDKVLAICSVLVFIFLWIAFRRLELALCAFLPMVVSWIWITGIMGIFGVSFNIVNIILATFIFGLGDDYTIFMVEGLQYEYTNKKPLLQSYKTGVTLSAITMFVGVGSLIFALHPALHSLGAVAVIGLICVVLLAFMLPPVIFRFLVCKSFRKERKERVLPIRLSDIFITLYCAAVFAAVCLWLKLITLFNPKLKGERLRSLITRYMRFFSSKMPRVKFFVKSEGKELKVKEIFEYTDRYFSSSEPCVIISNHQSHLDLLYYLSLSKKIVVVTNKWVYKSPVYGNFVRKAGNVCIEEGMEINREKLLSLKKEGCSILIFPEGTRSEDCDILKFRSGAFSMAEELQMDILPVVLFGPGEVFPKGEHLLRRGRVV
ncbi:MAG: 1-acyl-sn-glycerol-3-phosphate acyltransferase, partial [Bacteroidales bacterium]|nr:1-acyl-sn-glycerol-3-phosphate acyltransferase [Bacteroidales bacterium]